MTDDPTKRGGDELVIDWAEAVESWEIELDGKATAEASPLSTRPPPPPAADPEDREDTRPLPPRERLQAGEAQAGKPSDARAARPRMYRPPTPSEVAELSRGRRHAQPTSQSPDPFERSSQPPPLPSGSRTLQPFAPAEQTATYPTPIAPTATEDEPMLEILLESADLDMDGFEDTVESERPERLEKKARIARLEALAAAAGDEAAAELLTSAGELAEELVELGWAEALCQRAREKAPRRAEPLEALARLAFRAGDLARYTELLERMGELPLTRAERARLLTAVARVRFLVQQDAPAALGAATEAQRLAPEQLSPSLLLARIEAATDPAQADATLVPLSQRTPDLALSALWLVAAGRAVEARGDTAGARVLYDRAAQVDPYAFDAQLSLARVQHALGNHAEAAEALLRTLENFDIGPVAEAVRRRAAHMLGHEGRHAEAVELLEHASDDVSLRTAMQVALASRNRALMLQAADSWTLGTSGPERALALLAQAELLVEEQQAARAAEALELAAIEDPGQRLVQLAREALARREGDTRRLAELTAGEEAGSGALAAAAKLVLSSGDGVEELTWLLEAADEESGVVAHVLASDASAELGRSEQLRGLLLAQGHRGALPARVRALLALGELERTLGNEEAARAALRHAVELAPSGAVALRAYARARPSGGEIARAYADEAEGKDGPRAAFLYLRAGFAASEPGPRLEAFARALRADPAYAPASWALQREARRQGDLACLGELHGQEAARAESPRERVAHLVRAALIRAGEDGDAAAAQLSHALSLTPDDPVLAELVLRLGDASPAAVRVDALERIASRLEEPFRRPLVLAAGGVLEDAGRYPEAEERYRRVLAAYPDDPLAAAGLERAVAERTELRVLVREKQRAASDATTERARARLLEELLLLEPTGERALEWARELLALEPAHALAARALEREAMRRDDRAELLALEERAYQHGTGPHDRAARMRLLHLLHALGEAAEASLEALDAKLLEHPDDAEASAWLARQVTSVAIAAGQRALVVRAVEQQAAQTSDPLELAALAVQRGWLTLESPAEALAGLPSQEAPGFAEHPTYLELLAEAQRAAGQAAAAAESFEQAAARALGSERAAHLWARAAELWDSALGDPARARTALLRAAEKDVGYPGVGERLLALLSEQGDLPGLAAFTRAAIRQGGSGEQLSELHRKLAALHAQQGDDQAAVAALREGLAQAPEHLPSWRDLARLLERGGEHEARVEALTAIGRLSRDPLELRDVFLELGQLHEREVPDPARAAAAYQRVLKLGPRNTQALERLAGLYHREGKHALAIDTLSQLVACATDPVQVRDVTVRLATWKEEHGDPRGAEELLETLRRASPTDHELLRSLAGLLKRAGEQPALTMHLNRSVNDLRHALAEDLDRPDHYRALVDLLIEKGRADAAAHCAATALALELDVPDLAEHLGREQGGIGDAALSELLDDLVFPASTLPSLRILFRHGAEALNKAVPLEVRTLGAERLDKRHPLRAVTAEYARWSGGRELDVFTSADLPYAFVPIQDSPPLLLVGEALLDALSPAEQRFLIVRALKIARAQMSISCRLRPNEMELLLHALVRSQVASHAPPFIEATVLEEATRRVSKQLSRRAQTELGPYVLELTYAGVPSFDASSVYGAASAAGGRAALLALGDVGAALSALVKLSALPPLSKFVASVMQVEEARELAQFALSDGYVEARIRAGKEAR